MNASTGVHCTRAGWNSVLEDGVKEALFRTASGREPETWKLGIAGAFRHLGASPFCCEPQGGLESPVSFDASRGMSQAVKDFAILLRRLTT